MKANGDMMLIGYQPAEQIYLDNTSSLGEHLTAYLDRIAAQVGSGGFILELGSGAGRTAQYLESKYLRVRRTDAAPAFVDMLRAEGHHADVLDIRTDALGGPYDAVVATTALLDLTRGEVENVLQRTRFAIAPDGVLAFTIKTSRGSAPSGAELDAPRQVTYWRESELRGVLARTGWVPLVFEHADLDGPRICVVATSSADAHM